MRAIRRILAAVKDPGARALPAVNKAVQLARALDAELELFHAIDSPYYTDMLGMTAERTRRMEFDESREYLQRLERIAARARLHARRVSVAVEWDYPAYEAIVRRSLKIGADLVVTECHAGRRIAPGLLRLSDWELLRLSPLPVLLVKGMRPYHHPTILMALDPSHAFAKPARLDEEIVQVGSAVAAALRGRLHAVHAYATVTAGMAGPAAAAGLRAQEAAAASARVSLDHALRSTAVPPACRHVVAGDPTAAVRNAARRLRAGIVVAGAVSRSGLKGAFIGNTAERLLDRLSCDLLIVKPAEFACPVPRTVRGARLVAVEPLG
ncbi:MAG TPA: universal stress protein [Steroidobacteraceae bacterium]|nr:universal stress protein [Steroidobacteraceae bacterium]